MPVFDFSSASEEKEAFVCTYTAFTSDSSEKTPDDPILVLDNQQKQWSHHSTGVFATRASGQHLSLRRRTRHFVPISCGSMHVCEFDQMAWGEPYQRSFVWGKQGGRLCRVQDQGKCFSWRHETFRSGWIFAVCDGTPFIEQRTGAGG